MQQVMSHWGHQVFPFVACVRARLGGLRVRACTELAWCAHTALQTRSSVWTVPVGDCNLSYAMTSFAMPMGRSLFLSIWERDCRLLFGFALIVRPRHAALRECAGVVTVFSSRGSPVRRGCLSLHVAWTRMMGAVIGSIFDTTTRLMSSPPPVPPITAALSPPAALGRRCAIRRVTRREEPLKP